MRRRTGWALCGVAAGTLVLGAGGTLASFSDTETLTATAGAGRLALEGGPSDPAAARLTLGPAGATLPVVPVVDGDATASLRLSAIDAAGWACDPRIVLRVTVPLPAEPVEADLCTLTRDGLDLFQVSAGTPDLQLPVTVSVTGEGSPAARQWRGELVLTLVQAGGGFSDEQRLPAHVVAPNPQGNGNGNGNSNSNGGGNGGGGGSGNGNGGGGGGSGRN